MRIRWTTLAQARATEAFEIIATQRPDAAARWLGRVLDRVALLATHPDSGRVLPEANRPDLREVIVKPYRVIYRRDAAQVIILTIRHVRREYDPDEIAR